MTMIENILTGSPFVQGGLTLMIAGWLGYQLRAMPGRAYGAARGIFTRVIEVRENHPLYDAWLGMLTEGAVRPGGPRTLEVRATTDEWEDRAASSAFAAGTASFWARVCGRWCRVWVHRDDAAGSPHDLVRRFVITVEVLFGTSEDLTRMLRAAKDRANVVEDRQLVDLCDKYGSKHTMSLPKRARDTLCLPRGFFESFESRVAEFQASREDYERIGVPWRFGVLLHGEPGTGKTSLAHAIASARGLRLAVIPLADLRSDEDLVSSFESVRDGSVVLIEDVDCAFRQRKSEDAEGVTFSGFLNCIDGVVAPHNGRVLIMSTNHIDRLDPALIRPGRVDLRLEVPLLAREAAVDYVDRLFPHVPERHDLVDEVMNTSKPTAAVLINRIMKADWRRERRAEPAPARGPSVGRAVRTRRARIGRRMVR